MKEKMKTGVERIKSGKEVYMGTAILVLECIAAAAVAAAGVLKANDK